MADEFDKQMAEQWALIDDLRSDMRPVRERFMAATAEFLASWYPQRARLEFERFPEDAAKLQPHAAKSLKEAVQRLATQARDMADDAVGAPELWWDTQQNPTSAAVMQMHHFYAPDRPQGGALPSEFEQRIRRVMGRLAHVFAECGFARLENTRAHGADRVWRDLAPTPRGSGERQWSFAGDVAWPFPMGKAMTDYANLHGRVRAAFDRIRELEQQKARKQATDLWDSL